jgi:hypothetical protein
MNDSISQKSGIYKIINYITGDLYIGQTYDFYNRRRHHLLSLMLHDLNGDGSIEAGHAWDSMRHKGDKAIAFLHPPK